MFNDVKADGCNIVPQNAHYIVISTSKEPLWQYTICGPPKDVDGAIPKTRDDAKDAHEHLDGKTTK